MPPRKRKPTNPSGKPCKDCNSPTRPAPYQGPRCATCFRAFKKKSKGKCRDAYLMRTYKLSQDQYDRIKELQGGKCFICRRATGASKNLAVDHDHSCCPKTPTCGKCTRGLLCSRCNHDVLGHLRDDVDALLRAVDYLNHPPALDVIG